MSNDDALPGYTEPPLPSGWESKTTATGKVYYIDHNTKTTTWDRPPLAGSVSQSNVKEHAPQPQQQQKQAVSSGTGVFINSVEITQPSLQMLQTSIFPQQVMPGRYWYDKESGGYGFEGGPCLSFTTPYLSITTASLPSDASGKTGTSVYINGREIHMNDVVQLQSIGIPTLPGRYWLRGDGSYGHERVKWLPLGNLRVAAQQSRQRSMGGGAGTGWSSSISQGFGFSAGGGDAFCQFRNTDGSYTDWYPGK